jgi:hypothetical protein
VRNLTDELQHVRHWAVSRLGIMSRETRLTIDKVLHNDTRNSASEDDKDEACKLWNVWKNEHDKARRRAR